MDCPACGRGALEEMPNAGALALCRNGQVLTGKGTVDEPAIVAARQLVCPLCRCRAVLAMEW